MALSVNSNIPSLVTQTNLNASRKDMEQAMERLSSGLRINSAKDDAAGLAISEKMTSDIRGLAVAVRNANDGMSMAQTAEGAMGEITDILQRMRELSAQAANGTMSADNRTAIQAEMDQLINEIDNISDKTNFNGIKLLDGSASSIQLQTGVNQGDTVSLAFNDLSAASLGLRGFSVEGTLTTGRVSSTVNVAAGDVKINGFDALGGALNVTASSTVHVASDLASAINANIGSHRVAASAYNTLTGSAPTQTTFAEGDLQINALDVGAAASVEELVTNINRDTSGVLAALNDDGTITLSNDTGDNIIIAGNAPGAAGFSASTYTGYVALTSLDGEPVEVLAEMEKNGYASGSGSLADVQSFGLNEQTAEGATLGSQVSSAALTTDDILEINGVRIGITDSAGAAAKAEAVNAISEDTGVTATALTEIKASLDMTNRPQTATAQVQTFNVVADTTLDLTGDTFDVAIDGYTFTIEANTNPQLASVTASVLHSNLSSVAASGAAVGTASAMAAGIASFFASAINADSYFASKVTATSDTAGNVTLTANEAGEAFQFALDGRTLTGAATDNLDLIFSDLETTTANVSDGSDDIRINGKTVDLTAATDVNLVVSTINATAVPGVEASADSDGNLILTSVSGENIKIETFSAEATEFFDTVQNLAGETNALSATIKVGGTIETTDVFEVTVNGTSVAVTAGSTDASVVASTVASALDADATVGALLNATANADGSITIAGVAAGDMLNIELNTGEVIPTPAGRTFTDDLAGGLGNYGSPSDGQTFSMTENGIEMFGSLTLASETGADIIIEDISGAAAVKLGLSAQGGTSDMVGGSMSVQTQVAAEQALTSIDAALSSVSLNRADLGALQNRLDAAVSNLTSTSTNLSAARSQILDADYAAETTALTKSQVVQQAATAMLAQANQTSQMVLSLLQ
jgi:flagellin